VSARRAGFTLLEMLAVVMIIGLISSLVLPGLGFATARTLENQAQQLAAALEFARQRTVMTSVPHRVVLDLDAEAWWVEWQPAPEAPDATALEEAERESGRIDLSPPPTQAGEFAALESGVGRRSRLPDGVYLASVSTPEGVVERERVAVAFERDGSADPTEITLLGDGGTARVLQVRPLADAVRILDAS
jgi:type II secretion system protein H